MTKKAEIKSHVMHLGFDRMEHQIFLEDWIDPDTGVVVNAAHYEMNKIGENFWICFDEDNQIFAPAHEIRRMKIESEVTRVVHLEQTENGWDIVGED